MRDARKSDACIFLKFVRDTRSGPFPLSLLPFDQRRGMGGEGWGKGKGVDWGWVPLIVLIGYNLRTSIFLVTRQIASLKKLATTSLQSSLILLNNFLNSDLAESVPHLRSSSPTVQT